MASRGEPVLPVAGARSAERAYRACRLRASFNRPLAVQVAYVVVAVARTGRARACRVDDAVVALGVAVAGRCDRRASVAGVLVRRGRWAVVVRPA